MVLIVVDGLLPCSFIRERHNLPQDDFIGFIQRIIGRAFCTGDFSCPVVCFIIVPVLSSHWGPLPGGVVH